MPSKLEEARTQHDLAIGAVLAAQTGKQEIAAVTLLGERTDALIRAAKNEEAEECIADLLREDSKYRARTAIRARIAARAKEGGER